MSGLKPLYQVENPYGRASALMASSANTYGGIRTGSKQETEGPGKTAGGAIMAGAGGAATGSAIGSAVAGASAGSAGGWWGAAAGFCVGLAAYYLS